MTIDIDKAKSLREQGKTLQEVADILGCSLAWCKINLKGTKQANRDKQLIEAIRTKGKSKEGVTSVEVRLLVTEAYPNLNDNELEVKLNAIKKAARRDNKDVLIRPCWMLPEQAYDCTTMMLEFAQELYEMKQYLARKFRKEFDMSESFHNSVAYTLTMMSAGENNKLMPQGLIEYGRQLGQIQDALADRQEGKNSTVQEIALDDSEQLVTLDDIDLSW